ncbi:MAG: copper chaperone PCu(A)C [Gemmatimonas sp.]
MLFVAQPASAQSTRTAAGAAISTATKSATITATTTATPGNARIAVTGAWARPALKGGTGGMFMTIINRTGAPVAILRATSPDAAAVELHETSVHDGMAHMNKVPTLVVGARDKASLAPGGRHYMLLKLTKGYVSGDTAKLVLHLDGGDSIMVKAGVRLH